MVLPCFTWFLHGFRVVLTHSESRKIKLMVATEQLAELFMRRSQVKHLRTLKSRPAAYFAAFWEALGLKSYENDRKTWQWFPALFRLVLSGFQLR